MGVSPAIFESGGQRSEHYVPGVYSRSFNVSSPVGISAGNLCILGKSKGGKPFELYEFGGLADAQNILSDGELLDAVAIAFTASNTYVPQRVFAMRVNDGTQASIKLMGGAVELLDVKAWDWGVHTNQVKIMVADGTTAGSKKITVAYKDKTNTVDNIIKSVMNVRYYGEGENPVVSIDTNSINFSAITTGETPETIDTLTVSFEDFNTLDELSAYINNSAIWQATVIGNNGSMEAVKLDTVSSAAIDSENGLTLYANFDAFLSALASMQFIGKIEQLNTSTRIAPDNTDGYKYFTGGTVGAYTVTQWQKALAVLELKDIQIIATPSTDTSIHAMISAHCTSMSNVINRKERTAILGGNVGMTDDEAISAAQGLNNKFVSFCCDNPQKINVNNGNEETLSGAMLGVMLAAMESAMSPSTPLTFKQLNVLGFTKVRDVPNLTKLIQGGVLVCNSNPENLSEYICIRALTTFQGDDLINNERSMVREDLFMNRDLRAQFRPAIGTAGTRNNAIVSPNAAINVLTERAKQWALNGYIYPSDSNENVWDIKVRVDGDKTYITYSRYLTAPVNFVFITAANHVYTSTQEL